MSPVPMPPVEFQTLVCGPGDEPLFEEVGCWLRDALYHQGMLQSNANLLDVGCGCGRLARALLDAPIGSYTGFDRHKGMVDWCLQEIRSRDPRFRFDYFDLKSVYTVLDHQAGSIDAETFRFPTLTQPLTRSSSPLSSLTCCAVRRQRRGDRPRRWTLDGGAPAPSRAFGRHRYLRGVRARMPPPLRGPYERFLRRWYRVRTLRCSGRFGRHPLALRRLRPHQPTRVPVLCSRVRAGAQARGARHHPSTARSPAPVVAGAATFPRKRRPGLLTEAGLVVESQVGSWHDAGTGYRAGLYGDVITSFHKPAT